MTKQIALTLIFSVWICFRVSGQAQKLDTSKASIQLFKELIERGSYFSAIPELEKLNSRFPLNQNISLVLAEAYQAARLPEKAASSYEAAYNPKSKSSVKILLPIVQNYYNAGNYSKAKSWIEQIDKRRDADGNTKTRAKLILQSIEEISKVDTISSRYAMDTSYKFPNSGYADFAPGRMNDSTLIFSSLRIDSVVNYNPALTNFNTTKIFVYRQAGANFDNIESPKSLNSLGVHTGNGSFTPDKRHFYFTKCIENRNGKLNCAIYLADVLEGKFKNVRKLDGSINKSGSSNTQPFVVTSLLKNTMIETLFFVSDRKGGSGGKDIFMATYNIKKGSFGNAANLGKVINTSGDEQSPFIDEPTGHLYFSSNFHTGYGGSDVFLSRKLGNAFGKPINLGKPVNSAADDVFFRFDGSSGAFIASNRKGAHELEGSICCEDIFYMKRLPKLDSIQWLAFQKAAKEISKPIAKVTPKNVVPESIVKQEVKVEPKKYETPLNQIGKVDLKKKNDSKGIDNKTTTLMKAISQNIQFEPGSNRVTVSTLPHLDSLSSLLKLNKNYKLILTGHTDSKGSKAINTRLSKDRAEAVKNYLVEKGVEKSRISTIAKGPLVPLFANKKPDGSDNPEGRSKNRRVTLNLIKTK